jgi:hypothetical protein
MGARKGTKGARQIQQGVNAAIAADIALIVP